MAAPLSVVAIQRSLVIPASIWRHHSSEAWRKHHATPESPMIFLRTFPANHQSWPIEKRTPRARLSCASRSWRWPRLGMPLWWRQLLLGLRCLDHSRSYYPLVNWHSYGQIYPFWIGKSTINVVFSIAMLNYRRVNTPSDTMVFLEDWTIYLGPWGRMGVSKKWEGIECPILKVCVFLKYHDVQLKHVTLAFLMSGYDWTCGTFHENPWP